MGWECKSQPAADENTDAWRNTDCENSEFDFVLFEFF